jgi:geranylgeranyl diphosphate synthase type II
MIGGQVVDLLGSHDNMEEDKLIFMYKMKTAALIQSSIVSGAILGGASYEDIEILREFGLKLGLAYQIRDDLLDREEDNIIDKITYIRHYNKDKAKREVEELSQEALRLLHELKDKDTSFLEKLTFDLIHREV